MCFLTFGSGICACGSRRLFSLGVVIDPPFYKALGVREKFGGGARVVVSRSGGVGVCGL